MEPASCQFSGALNFVVAAIFSENLYFPELLTDYVIRKLNFWKISFIVVLVNRAYCSLPYYFLRRTTSSSSYSNHSLFLHPHLFAIHVPNAAESNSRYDLVTLK
jgi:hypothetical protein